MQREKIIQRVKEMREAGEYVNKSRIAREVRCSIRTVFRVLPLISRL